MAALLLRLLQRLHEALRHVPHEIIMLIFIFWMIQLIGWVGMMIYVGFFNHKLGQSVLYVTQISHWALVEAAGTAALSSWALLQAKHNQRKLEQLQHETENLEAKQSSS